MKRGLHLSRQRRGHHGFTLIEILVVVAILALLIAILLPSLARARDQAKTAACGSNIRQLAMAANMYTQDGDGRYPASTHEYNGSDWIGLGNPVGNQYYGDAPEAGVLFKYLGRDKKVYTCPAHKKPQWIPSESWYYSYEINGMMTGGKPEWVNNAHHPIKDFNKDDHRLDMAKFSGVPLFFEPFQVKPDHYYTSENNSWFTSGDTLANRHLRNRKLVGVSNVANTDGSVEQLRLPGYPQTIQNQLDAYVNSSISGTSPAASIDDSEIFHARDMCLQMMSGKWVSMRSFLTEWRNYGFLGYAPDASSGSSYNPYENEVKSFDPVIHK